MKYLKIHTLEKGYKENEDIILHAVFQVLTDYVEIEKPFKWFDWETKKEKELKKEIKYLYKWWTKIRPNRVDAYTCMSEVKEYAEPEPNPTEDMDTYSLRIPLSTPEFKAACRKAYNKDNCYIREDIRMAKRVIDIMHYMWT